MPGVRISTAVRTGPTTNTVRESSQAFFVGKAVRGPADRAVLITSLDEFENTFGGYVSTAYLHPTVQTFFEEGGTQCWVAKAESSSHVESTATLVDDSDPAEDVLTFTAVGGGTWADGQIPNPNYTGTPGGDDDPEGDPEFISAPGLSVEADGVGSVSLLLNGVTIFSTGAKTTTEEIVASFNNSAIASRYVTVVADSETLMPAVQTVAFDGGAGTHGDIVDQDLADAMALFLDAYGTGAIACPESETSTVYEALVTHANAFNRIALLHTASGTADPSLLAGTIIADTDVVAAGGEHAGLYWPWVTVPGSIAGITRSIPPDGYVAAVRSRAHNQIGPQAPAAGIISNARYVTGLEFDTNKATADGYDAAQVNVIRIISGTIRVYGARSLTADVDNFRYLTAQDIVNGIVVDANRSLEDVVFSVIDGRNNVFATVEAKLIAVLEPLRTSGALYEAFDSQGRRIDYGYTVKCDASLNPITSLAEGLVQAKVGVRVSSVGDQIEVDIVKSNLTNSVV
jgi:phage tail sheath protein FI